MIESIIGNKELSDVLRRIFQRGNTAELKMERGRLVVVEIERHVRQKI